MAIPETTKHHIVSLYNNNLSIVKISEIVKVSSPTISKILKSFGIGIRTTNYQKLDLDKELINKMYDDGMSTYEIAEHFKCSDETIRNLIVNVRDTTTRNKLSQDSIDKIAAAAKLNWKNDEYVKKVMDATSADEYKLKLSIAGKNNYQQSLGDWLATTEAKLIISKAIKDKWLTTEYQEKQRPWFQLRVENLINASKVALSDPIKREAWLNKLRISHTNRQTNTGWISTAQKQLYYILSTSNIVYHEEGVDTKISPFYVVDCVIPQQQMMKKPLIIEVQGEYWHSLPNVIIKDKQKSTYIRKHTDYDLLHLDELCLSSFDVVKSKLEQYGLTLSAIECSVSQLEIKQIPESEASMFYSIFHYSGTIRKGAIVFGAYFNDELIAAISYCYPIRLETAKRLGYKFKEVLEISRFARCTNLKCKNLASYLLSKSRLLLPKSIKCIISFSDQTYGHSGGMYKAAGFVLDGIIEPDYYYLSINGKYHKKTIWNKSKKMKLSEEQYALKHNLLKVPTKQKTRWVYKIS